MQIFVERFLEGADWTFLNQEIKSYMLKISNVLVLAVNE